MLTTCPSILKSLLDKSNLINSNENINQNKFNYGEQRIHSASSVTFTTNFVKYFIGIFKISNLNSILL